jgi:hypothetical protein
VSRDEVDEVTPLANGIMGYYTARSCGGSCAPPQISWTYKGALYTIQFKVNNKTKKQDEAETKEVCPLSHGLAALKGHHCLGLAYALPY